MKRALAILILALPVLYHTLFWGCLFICGLVWQVVCVSSTCLVRVAKGHEETFCGVWNLTWDESYSAFVWDIIRKPF
jgi:hypothetical protein